MLAGSLLKATGYGQGALDWAGWPPGRPARRGTQVGSAAFTPLCTGSAGTDISYNY
ncbi:MAG: hypothetical protein KME26_18145 [Oscillatoria princeps RMCB-10]|nr:hypothetical protein [Oscillatoria princeps RMCB-10]